ncbi:hypothetical protein BHE74_00052486, partial [Ensete ventricosum]
FARRFAKGIEKLAGNMPEDRRKKIERLRKNAGGYRIGGTHKILPKKERRFRRIGGAATERDYLEPSTFPYQGVPEPHLVGKYANRHDAGYHPTPVSTGPISNVIILTMINTSTSTSSNAQWDPPTQCNANILGSPKAHGIVEGGNAPPPNYGIQYVLAPLLCSA